MKAQKLALALLAPLLVVQVSGTSTRSQDPLSANTGAGVVVDREGVAARKAVLADRWGPADARTRVELGDWLKTGSRGANALAVELAGGADLLLGPGTLVEVASGSRIELMRGELRANATEDSPLDVAGPGGATFRLIGRGVLRARDGKLTALDEDPGWLTGYEEGASTEALGTLLANVDGRDLPLTIGYHKVTVDIRDQIARTVIEESFINHTPSILEGVFYFPLPAGASISGFGMWIGGELVEGDIVEKQRAREIYETILRERRDPGLLEWTGGNIFKARVFPIGAEKRIRIAYTQVLPKDSDTFAYHYSLDSEMLRKTPLSRLQIEVNVASSEALDDVSCPSHECRVRKAQHSARIEFDAEEYSPDRDFELRVRTKKQGFRVTAVPHRRGDDGYFMLLLDTPDADGEAPQAGPLDVLVVADTSGSMWGSPRTNQIAFVEALVGALSERDTLNLMTCDSDARFASPRPRAADDAAREEALAFLEKRAPLGWSDLDAAFAAAFAAAGPNTHVVYVGDGQNTSGDADPIALAQRIARGWPGNGTFHAVVPGSRSELGVLRALAGLGGGSVRSIGGGSDPAQTAFALLREIAAPAAKDLVLGFEGMSVAAVYPEVLPNLTLGGQQVVVGRFDPSLGEAAGRVTVTGTLNGAPVRFAADIDLAAGEGAEAGNSFIPRLWARHHLDHLLDQGRSSETRERVIALSEDFQIITPYTSFLVLESDADRERFQVQRRFRMRDGEDFFAEGRESGRHELLRQQMLAAKTWRKRLRAETLETLGRMNRELTELLRGGGFTTTLSSTAGLGMYVQDFDTSLAVDSSEWYLGSAEREVRLRRDVDKDDREWDEGQERLNEDEGLAQPLEEAAFDDETSFASSGPSSPASSAPASRARMSRLEAVSKSVGFERGQAKRGRRGGYAGEMYGGRPNFRPFYHDPFQSLFPSVGPPRAAEAPVSWPADVLRLLATLDRRSVIGASDVGWRIEQETTYTDTRGRKQITSGAHILGKDRWVVRSEHAQGQMYQVQWLADGIRGRASMGWNLARVRPARDGDEGAWYVPFSWYFGDQLRGFAKYEARLSEGTAGRVTVSFSTLDAPGTVIELEIEPERALVVEQRWVIDGEVTARITYGAFQQVGGVWWPGEIRNWNTGRSDSRLKSIRVVALDSAAFASEIAAALPPSETTILLDGAEPELAAAKQAAQGGSADLEDRWRLLRYFAETQRWELAAPQLAAIESLEAGKPGLAPMRAIYLDQSRRGEELRALLMELAGDLAVSPRDAEHGIAQDLMNRSGGLNQGGEVLALLEVLEPVFARQTAILDARLAWDQRMHQALLSMGRPEDAFALQTRMVAAYPAQVFIQTEYASTVARRGDVDVALEFLSALEAKGGPWLDHEGLQIRRTRSSILWNSYRLADFVRTALEWQRGDSRYLDAGLVNQYLSALVFLDREDDAFELVKTWLTEYRKAKLEPLELARLQGGVRLALGQGHNLYYQRFDDDRAALVAETARALDAIGGDVQPLANQIVTDWRFRQTDASRALMVELYAELESGVRALPAKRIEVLFNWLGGKAYATDAGEPGWDAILAVVFERWVAATTDTDRNAFAQVILRHGSRELIVRHHRRVLETADGDGEVAAAARTLFYALLDGPWSADVQAELVGLLPRVAVELGMGTSETHDELDGRILALCDLMNWLPGARAQAEVAALPDVNSMPRRLLAAKKDELTRTARLSAAELLGGLAESLEPAGLRPWASIERAFFLVRTRTDLRDARERATVILAGLARQHATTEVREDVPLRDRILAARCAATVANLLARYDDATRAAHEPAFVALLDAGIASDAVLLEWRDLKYALLVAQGRGDEVETELTAWYGGGTEFERMRWGRDFAHILAERGKLAQAVAALLEVERQDELTHDDYRALADWYTALDRAGDAREMRIRSYEVQGENTIGQALTSEMYAYDRRGDEVPPELDAEIPPRFAALLRKATNPANWCWVLARYYAPTQDFRLLECLPEGVIGQSAMRIYPFLANIGSITEQIHEEATVDRLRAHLADIRGPRAKTDVDRRALSLLEFMVVQRAGRQAHGTEDHEAIALQALRDAFRGEWQPGEPLLMADFLAGRGALEPASLASEQLRQIRELHRIEERAHDRFHIAAHLANRLWEYGRKDDALRTMEGALDAFRAASGGGLSTYANDQLVTFTAWLKDVGAYARAERVWLEELAGDLTSDQALWLEARLLELYRDAVLARAGVSLGRGTQLYTAVHAKFLAAVATRTNENHANELVGMLCEMWRRCDDDLHLEQAPRDAASFAFGGLPRILDRYQYRGGQSMVGSVADCLSSVKSELLAIEFLAVRAENEPRWLRLVNQDFWRQHSWRLANLRRTARRLPERLEQRVLAIVTHELREDLRTRQAYNRTMYDVRYSDYWKEKRASFRSTALAFLEERAGTGAAVVYVTDYLVNGLRVYDEAIDGLFRAHRRGILDVTGRTQLATFLQSRKRWKESIPVLTALCDDRPGDVNLRVLLMRGHDGVDDRVALERDLQAATAWFREHDAWDESTIAALAAVCLDTKLFGACAELYDEAIALHVKTAPNRGVGDGTLSFYYQNLAGAHSGLGDTDAAVDAAAGAIVSWGSNIGQRMDALKRLEDVLDGARDLDAYTVRLDATCAASGLENPILRKALGAVYLKRKKPERAAEHLRRALLAAPNDVETHAQLVAACDSMRRADLAAEAQLEWARAAGHDVALYTQLGVRLAKLDRSAEAERAYTTVVEVMPNESESHAALAEVREKQGRWEDSVQEWRHVIRVRTAEPTGYLGLAQALIRLKRWDEARNAAQELVARDWPERFGDVHAAGRELLRKIPRSE